MNCFNLESVLNLIFLRFDELVGDRKVEILESFEKYIGSRSMFRLSKPEVEMDIVGRYMRQRSIIEHSYQESRSVFEL